MRFRGIVYRAHDPRWSWPPVSGEGARLHGGRFNRVGVPAFYASLSPVTAIREASPLGQPLQPNRRSDADPCAYEMTTCDAGHDSGGGRSFRRFAAGRFRPECGPASDVNLVLWRWGDRRPSRIVLIDDERRIPKRAEE